MWSAGAMMAQFVSGKAARDALFLSTFGAKALPWAMVSSAILALFAVLGFGRLLTRFSPARVVPLAFLTSATFFVLEWLLFTRSPTIAAGALYLHAVALGAVLSSGFWSVVNERFDPHSAKPVIGRIAAGGSVGGLVGGLVSWQLASLFKGPVVLFLLAALGVAASIGISAVCGTRTTREEQRSDTIEAPAQTSGIQVIATVPYLRNLALLVLLGAAIQALLDYALGLQATALFSSGPAMLSFFSIFYTVTGALSLVAQLTLSQRVLQNWGLAVSAAILPISVMFGAVSGVISQSIVGASLARGVEAVARNSVYRAGYELFFTPLPAHKKRPSKVLIDVGFDRIGTAVGSGIVMTMPILFASQSWNVLMGLTFALAALASGVALRLRSGYVKTLAESLQEGSVRLSDAELADGNTIGTIAATAKAIDRQALLREIAKLHKQGQIPGAVAPINRPSEGAALVNRILPSGAMLETLTELMSGDAARIRKALQQSHGSGPALAAHVIPVLENNQVAPDAVKLLRDLAPKIVGQLIDALLDTDQPVAVRRRIPRALRSTATQRAIDGLMAGLKDEDFDVRRACARTLFELTGKNEELSVSAVEVYDAIQKQLSARKDAQGQQVAVDEEEPSSATSELDLERDYVFRLLCLVLDREPLGLAFNALRTEDANLRGTALEYLENVLPHSIMEALYTKMAIHQTAKPAPRPREHVVNELMKSRARIESRLDELFQRKSDGSGN